MQKHLNDYIKVYKVFDDSTCDMTVELLKSVKWKDHDFLHADGTYAKRVGDKELSVSYDILPTTQTFMTGIYPTIQKYYDEFKFPWFDSWQGYSQVRWNRYNENTMMDLHCDNITDLFDGTRRGIPMLSIVGQLNSPDDYTGGEFVMFEDSKVELQKGEIVIFPSNFLYPHRVQLVNSGTRYSFVSWVW